MDHHDIPEEERDLVSDQELAIGLTELHLEGLIEFRGDGEFLPTGKGIDYAYDLFDQHSPKEKLALTILIDTIRKVVETEGE